MAWATSPSGRRIATRAVFFLLLLSLIVTPLASATPKVILILGAEGTPEFGQQFTTWADRFVDAAQRASASVTQIGRDEAPPESSHDRDRLKDILAAEAKQSDDPLWLIFIGHGTFDGREAKFNLRGPDVSDSELAEWLKPAQRPLAIINCASASAPFLNKLSGPDRVVITSTRSGAENNFARFGDHLSSAIADPSADLDKDGQTSLLEAFLAASHRTEMFYKQESRLATEHALMDDNADKLGVAASFFRGTRAVRTAKDGAPVDGLRAHQWHLVLSPSEQAMPQALRVQRDALEMQVETLRAAKPTLPEEQYYAQLEPLLLKLAHLYHPSPHAP